MCIPEADTCAIGTCLPKPQEILHEAFGVGDGPSVSLNQDRRALVVLH